MLNNGPRSPTKLHIEIANRNMTRIFTIFLLVVSSFTFATAETTMDEDDNVRKL
jgi:hypothetical protein